MCILDGTTALDSNSSIQSKKALFLLYNSLGLLGIITYLMGLKREKKERQTTPSVKKNSFFFLVDFQKNFC